MGFPNKCKIFTEDEFSQERDKSIEILKIVSAFFIVYYHGSRNFQEITYSGLIIFVILSLMFESGRNYARIRAPSTLFRRLLVPWIFWMAVYGVINLLRQRSVLPSNDGIIFGILYGTSAHLWFLPFLFFITIVFGQIKKYAAPSYIFIFSLLSTFILLVAAPWWRPWSLGLGYPMAQWAHAISAVFAGIVIGLARSVPYGSFAIVILIPALIFNAFDHIAGVSIPYTLAILLVVATSGFGSRFVPSRLNLEPVSQCMMGVYLVHILWLFAARPLIDRYEYIGITAAFIGSLASVYAMRTVFPALKAVI